MAAEQPITDGLLGDEKLSLFHYLYDGMPLDSCCWSGIQVGDDGGKRKKR